MITSISNNLFLFPCSSSERAIPYSIARNYFIKNDVKSIDCPAIYTKEKFDELFGAASFMGSNGKPTEIDFSKQYTIAIVLPETFYATEIKLSKLLQVDKKIQCIYQITTGEEQSYSITPLLLLVVDKIYQGEVVLT